MGIRWQKQFDDKFGNTWRLDLLDDQYSSGAQEIELLRDKPFSLEQRDASLEKLGLRSTFFSVQIEKSPEDIYSIVRGSDKGRFEIEIYKNGSLYYSGTVDPSLVQSTKEFGPRSFSIEGDDFSILKDYTGFFDGDFWNNSSGPFTSPESALAVVSSNLRQIGAQELHTVVEMIHSAGDASNDPLEEYGFWSTLGQKDGDAINKFDILSQLCKRFNWTITWAEEATYYLEEWTEKNGNSKTKYEWDLTQSTNGVGKPALIQSTSYSQSIQVDDVSVQREIPESRETRGTAKIIETSTDWRLDDSPNGRDFLDNSELRSQLPQPWNIVNGDGLVFAGETVRLDNTVSGAPGIGDVAIEQTFDLGTVPAGFKIDFNWRVTDGGAGSNGDNAFNFTVVANDNWALNDDWIEIPTGESVEEETETEVTFALPTNGDNYGYAADTIVLPKGTVLLFDWAKVKLKEHLIYDGTTLPSAVCDVRERDTNKNIRNAYNINQQSDTDPLLKEGQDAKVLTWLPYPTNDFGSSWRSIKSAEYQSRTQEVPLFAPDGTRIKGSLRAEIWGYQDEYGASDVEWSSFRIRPIGGGTDYRTVEEKDTEFFNFGPEEDANVFNRGELVIGTTPKDTNSSVIDISSTNLAQDWGSGLKLEEVASLKILKHAARPTDERNVVIRTPDYSPEKAIELDGDVYIPKQLEMNPAEGIWSGRFFKFDPKSSLNVVYQQDEGEGDEDTREDQPNNANTGTVIQPQLAPEVIASYLESEKDVLRLSGDLIQFSGASEFTEYLVSDDYDGDLPDSNGDIGNNGTTGFIIKDAYIDDSGTQTSPSEMIITNATIRDTLIEDGVDIGSGNFTGTDITLNNDFSGSSPTADGFLAVERGTKNNAQVLWDESEDKWKFGIDGSLKDMGGNFQGGDNIQIDDTTDPDTIDVAPQGDQSGLNADQVDGLEAQELIESSSVSVDFGNNDTVDISELTLYSIINDPQNTFSAGADTNELLVDMGPLSYKAEDESISGQKTHTSRILLDGTTLRSKGAATGFTGSGTIIDDSKSWFDDLQVRGSLIASTFELRQIRVSKGETMFSPGGGKIETVSGSGPYTLTFSEKPGITTSDLLLIKEASIDDTGNRTLVKDLELNVDGVSADAKTIDVSVNSGSSVPEEGDDVVVVGSSDGARDSSLFASPYTPALDVLDGISTFSQWNNRTPNARLGNISGMPSLSDGTSPSGFGLYSDNVFLEGTIVANKGAIADSVTVGGTAAQDLSGIFGQSSDEGTTIIDGGVIDTGLVALNSLAFTPLESDDNSTGSIIGTINASSEGINIEADNLNIGANTTFLSNDYDPSTKTPKTDGGVVIRSDAEPTQRPSGDSLQAGDIWVETDNNDKVYTYSGSSFFATKSESVVIRQPSEPNVRPDGSGLQTGDVWIDTDANDRVYTYDGTNWSSTFEPETSVTIRSDSEPTQRPNGEALKAGDIWIDTDDGDNPYSYNGSSFIAAYTNIDGGDITTGTISANRISVADAGDIADGVGGWTINSNSIENSSLGPNSNGEATLGEFNSSPLRYGLQIHNFTDNLGQIRAYIDDNGAPVFDLIKNTNFQVNMTNSAGTNNDLFQFRVVSNGNEVLKAGEQVVNGNDGAFIGNLNVEDQILMGSSGIITNSNTDFKIESTGFEVEHRNNFVQEASFSFFDPNDSTEYGAIYGDRFLDINTNQQPRINLDVKNGAAFRIFDSTNNNQQYFDVSKNGATSLSSDSAEALNLNAGTNLDIQTGPNGRMDVSGPITNSARIEAGTFLISGGYDALTFPGLDNNEFTFIYDPSNSELEIRAKDGNGSLENTTISLSDVTI